MSVVQAVNTTDENGSSIEDSRFNKDILGPSSSDDQKLQTPLGFDSYQELPSETKTINNNNNDETIRLYANTNPNLLLLNAPRKLSSQSENRELLSLNSRSRWKDLSSLEKSLSVALGLVSTVCLALMIAVIIVGVKLNKDDYKAPLKPTQMTEYPPWITTIKTTPGDIGEPEVTTRERPTSQPTTSTMSPSPEYLWNTCNSSRCFQVAQEILQNMDSSVDPCDDFYEFACGGFGNNSIPDHKSILTQFDKMRDLLNIQIKNILESNETEEYESSPIENARLFYESCLNQEDNNENDFIRELIEEMLIDWSEEPLINSSMSIVSILAKIRRELNGNYIFNLIIDTDLENPERNAIYLDKANLGIVSLNQLLNENISIYKTHIMEEWINIFPEDIDDAETIAENIIEFEKSLSKISLMDEGTEYQIQPYYDDKGGILGSGDEEFPEKPLWKYFVTQVFESLHENCSESLVNCVEVSPNVIIKDTVFFESVDFVLTEANWTTLENYLKWRIIVDFANGVNEADIEIDSESNQYFFANESTLRWEKCVEETNSFFGAAISALLIDQTIDDPYLLKEKLNEIAETLKQTFYEITEELSWISTNETHYLILEKMKDLKIFSGYPLSLWEDNMTAVVDFYSDLNLTDAESYYQNYLELIKWETRNDLETILKTTEETLLKEAFEIQSTVEIQYKPLSNAIYLPFGIFQSPVFRDLEENAMYLNYGSLGTLIGIQLMKALENTAMSYSNGSLMGAWDNETVDNFQNVTDCIKNQLNSLTVAELNNTISINGENTVRSNTADLGGLEIALRAYMTTNRFFENTKLPILDFNPDQLFFLGYAQTWCSMYTYERLLYEVSSGMSLPSPYRVKAVLENSARFAQTWKCPTNQNSETCQIW